ncbi:ATP synthase complex subunit H-domain-containing protein [Roridomyces roridus]|uniref:ATP synthase complex subunit H-domain-containing protein n=1 Tax=Roridomyces roridus TaxID=1738132 RepID=A0AAD7BT65_9AGAR|nr:ATP synthase complex subunit H-domain-containing protein [Roridomyces roridus]
MSTILRRAVSATRTVSTRSFSSSVARKDYIQDLYLKEIKAYKAPPAAKDAHVGVVKAYTQPPVPKAPALPTDLASELSAYDASEPAAATVAKTTSGDHHADLADGGAEAFLELLEADLPHEGHH